jgi:hypothetical protein
VTVKKACKLFGYLRKAPSIRSDSSAPFSVKPRPFQVHVALARVSPWGDPWQRITCPTLDADASSLRPPPDGGDPLPWALVHLEEPGSHRSPASLPLGGCSQTSSLVKQFMVPAPGSRQSVAQHGRGWGQEPNRQGKEQVQERVMGFL